MNESETRPAPGAKRSACRERAFNCFALSRIASIASRACSSTKLASANEQGFPQYDFATSWYGAVVPAATPPEVQARLEKMFIAASNNPASASKLEALGLEVVARPGKEGQERMLKERAAWKPVVEASGYVAED